MTNAFEETMRALIKDQGLSEMALVVVEHPIAGRSLDDTRKMADAAFPSILKAATQWQSMGK